MKCYLWHCGTKSYRVKLIDELGQKWNLAWDIFARQLPLDADEVHASVDDTFYLVLCDSREELTQMGGKVPPEFILEQSDFLLLVKDAKNPVERFRQRLKQLATMFPGGVDEDDVKSWFVGMLRRFCFQDEHVHGGSQCLSLNTTDAKGAQEERYVSWKRSREWMWFLGRFGVSGSENTKDDELKNAIVFLHELYGELKDVDELVKDLAEKSDGQQNTWTEVQNIWTAVLNKIAEVLDGYTKGGFGGQLLRHYSLTQKINILVVDDRAGDEIKKLDPSENQELNKLFEFNDALVKARVGASDHRQYAVRDIVKWVREWIDAGRSFDAILLDLSFGEEPLSDLTGYHLIPRLKQLIPQTPIIVYSQFDDMGHIVRALSSGANWFLKKDENERIKLARHMLALFSRHEWRKEWKTICNERMVGKPFEPGECSKKSWETFKSCFTAERQYLTYKSLEMFPGRVIRIKPMGGGFSTAVTFQAVKAPPDRRCAPLQSPLIVKIDTAHNTCLEYERYFRFIRPYIANQAGRIENPGRILDESHSAIVYTFAGRQDGAHELVTMKSLLERDIKNRSSCDYETYASAFDILYDEILPRIHAVEPDKEFDDASLSDFPNRVFDEIDVAKEDISICGVGAGTRREDAFLANYLCRMPFGRRLVDDDVQVISPQTAQRNGCKHCYEFHAKHISDLGSSLDVYDRKDKAMVSVRGAWIDHVVRYRPHIYPGMTLWMDKGCADEGFVLDGGIVPQLVKIYKKAFTSQNDVLRARVFNWFSGLIKDLLQEEIVSGLPSADGYFVGTDSTFNRALEGVLDRDNSAFSAVIGLFEIAKGMLSSKNRAFSAKLMQVRKGIVHGDLNYANIMLESRKGAASSVGDSGVKKHFDDVWLIDFARTRRDFVMHDYGVAFTGSLALLFDKEVWEKSVTIGHEFEYAHSTSLIERKTVLRDKLTYRNFINILFRDFVEAAVFGALDAVPDGIEHDRRFAFVYKILRRIRRAALKEGVSPEAYGFSVALSCMVASRIYLMYEENAPASAGMIAAAFICLGHLKKQELKNNDA